MSVAPRLAKSGFRHNLVRFPLAPSRLFHSPAHGPLGRNLKLLRVRNKWEKCNKKRNSSTQEGGAKRTPREQHALAMYKAKETARNAAHLTTIAAVAGLAIVAGYVIVKQIFPGSLSPQSVFSKSLDAVQKDEKVKRLFGTPIKGFGKDYGGHRVGRRNYIENISYIDDDGVEHTRILFNIEGSRGRGRVWSDRSSAHTEGQFYYLIVQDIRTNELWAIIDNRPKTPEAQRQEEVAALLTKNGVKLYGQARCQYTMQQLELFGTNATKLLEVVNCEDTFQQCVDANIQKLPTWDFNGKKVTGVQSVEDLYVLAKQKKNQ